MKITKFITTIVFLISLTTLISAFAPASHNYNNVRLLNDPSVQNNPIIQLINKNDETRAYFNGCVILTDETVLNYFKGKGGAYPATHDWAFFQQLLLNSNNDNWKACAYGVGLGHLIQDSYSHWTFVPSQLEKYKLTNVLGHVPSELALDRYVIKKYGNKYWTMTGQNLDVVTKDEGLMNLWDNLVRRADPSQSFSIKQNLPIFKAALASNRSFFNAWGITGLYELIVYGSLWVGLFLIFISVGFIFGRKYKVRIVKHIPYEISIFFILFGLFIAVGGLSGIIHIPNPQQVLDGAYQEQKYLLQSGNWQLRTQFEPTGFDRLNSLTEENKWYVLGTFFSIIGLIIIYTYLKIKWSRSKNDKKKR